MIRRLICRLVGHRWGTWSAPLATRDFYGRLHKSRIRSCARCRIGNWEWL